MTILVTGAAGFIGSHIVHELLARNEQVVALDNLTTGRRSAIPGHVPLVVGDAGDRNLVSDLLSRHDVSSVMHLAASTVVSESIAQPAACYANNTSVSLNLFDCAVRHRVKHVIFSSTAAVYGNPEHQPVRETDPVRPISPYGSSKLMAELMLRDIAAAEGLPHVVLRYFNVAGADPAGRTGQSGDGTHLIKVAVRAALGLRAGVDLFGTDYATPDGTGVRDFVHVSDIASAHLAALDHLRAGGASATLNCGYGHGYSVREVLAAVKRASGVDFPVRECPRRNGDLEAVVADNSAIRAVLAWTPRYDDLDVIVRHTLDWERRLMRESPRTDPNDTSVR